MLSPIAMKRTAGNCEREAGSGDGIAVYLAWRGQVRTDAAGGPSGSQLTALSDVRCEYVPSGTLRVRS